VSKSLYITSLEGQSGKMVVALALMEQLSGWLGSVSLFRPVVSESGRSDKLIMTSKGPVNASLLNDLTVGYAKAIRNLARAELPLPSNRECRKENE
jgi:hypothetical protein